MGDLDILVGRQDIQAAVKVARTLGYAEVVPEWLGAAQWLNQAANHHVHLQGGGEGKVILELHWALVAGEADYRTPPVEWFWQHKMGFQLPGVDGLNQVYQLTPMAHLLYLSAHLALQHAAGHPPLLWVYDLHMLVSLRGGEIDWTELVRQSERFGWAKSLRIAMNSACSYFGTILPAEFLQWLASQPAEQSSTTSTGNRLTDTLVESGTLDPRTRSRLILALVFPRPSYMRWRYDPHPTWLWLLYYPYRWFDILREGLKALRWITVKK